MGLTHPFRGGISHYTTLLCKALSKKHEVRFFALKRQYPKVLFPGKTQIDDSQVTFRVPHESCLDSMNPLSWFSTVKKISGFKADFILFSWWHPFFAPVFGTMAHLARWISRIPSCFLCHNVLPHEHSHVDRILLQYAFASGSAFITHSQTDRDILRQIKATAQVYIIHHPTYEVFSTGNRLSSKAAKKRLGLLGKKVLLFFGIIREYKGLGYLLDAMTLLEPEDNYHLLITGEFYDGKDPYRTTMEGLAKKGQITIVDRYVPNEDVPLYFSAADLVIIPYTSATQSGVIQIAYGFEKPVVATKVGGIPESVIDGQTGYLVPPSDAGAIATAVHRYFMDNNRDTFAVNILREKEKYSWDRVARTIERIGKALK